MAFSGLVQLLHVFPASADLSAHQFKFVQIDGTPELALAGATTKGFCLQDKPNAAGVGGTVLLAGKGKCIIGAAVAAGDYLVSDAAGLAIPAATASGVNDEVVGMALEDGATSGDLIEFLALQFTLQGA